MNSAIITIAIERLISSPIINTKKKMAITGSMLNTNGRRYALAPIFSTNGASSFIPLNPNIMPPMITARLKGI